MSASPFQSISAVDYTVLFARDMPAMRAFYEHVLHLPLETELSADWVQYLLGSNRLVLAKPYLTEGDAELPLGSANIHLAFRIAVAEVDACEAELRAKGIDIVSPATDRDFGHRTLFFRDPDGNLLEVYAEI